MSYRIHIQSGLDLGDLPRDITYTGLDTPVQFMQALNSLDKELTNI